MGSVRFVCTLAGAPFVALACSTFGASGGTNVQDGGAPASQNVQADGASPTQDDGGTPGSQLDGGPTSPTPGFGCNDGGSAAFFFCDNFEGASLDPSWNADELNPPPSWNVAVAQAKAGLVSSTELGGNQLLSLGFIGLLAGGGTAILTHAAQPGSALSIRFRFRIPMNNWGSAGHTPIVSLRKNTTPLFSLNFTPADGANGAGVVASSSGSVQWAVAPSTAYCFVLGVDTTSLYVQGPGQTLTTIANDEEIAPDNVALGWTETVGGGANLNLQYDDVALSTAPIACPD